MKDCLNSAVYNSKRSAIREFSALAKATPGCVALTLGEPDFDTPVSVSQAVGAALSNSETHYIANNGIAELREAISEYESKNNGLNYTPDEIIVTAGATEALWTAFFGIINPGDEVIIPTPAFMLYEEIVKLCRGVPVFLDTAEDGFQINAEKLNGLVNEKTKAIVINSPNNPTGCVYNKESLDAIHDAIAGKKIFAICDDVYRQLIYKEGYRTLAEYDDLRNQIIVVQSFSKPYAMTGWRMGYLMMPSDIKERLELIHQYTIVSTPAPFQRAAVEALKCDVTPMVETYRKRREYVLGRLVAMDLDINTPEGAFYVFPSIEKFGIPSTDFCRRMITEGGLACTPGSCFGTEGYIRLTYCYSDEELKEGLDRLEKFIATL